MFGGLLTSSINRKERPLLRWLRSLKKPEKILRNNLPNDMPS